MSSVKVVTERDAKVAEVLRLISKMHLPSRRKHAESTENLRWLNRNLGIQNSEHPNFNAAMELLKELI